MTWENSGMFAADTVTAARWTLERKEAAGVWWCGLLPLWFNSCCLCRTYFEEDKEKELEVKERGGEEVTETRKLREGDRGVVRHFLQYRHMKHEQSSKILNFKMIMYAFTARTNQLASCYSTCRWQHIWWTIQREKCIQCICQTVFFQPVALLS